MKYLFFDEYAIENIVSKTYFQSAEYAEGKKLLEYLKGNGCSILGFIGGVVHG